MEREPQFFSENMASLSATLAGISAEKIMVRVEGDKVLETVYLRMVQMRIAALLLMAALCLLLPSSARTQSSGQVWEMGARWSATIRHFVVCPIGGQC